jgi:hypothetical protein
VRPLEEEEIAVVGAIYFLAARAERKVAAHLHDPARGAGSGEARLSK